MGVYFDSYQVGFSVYCDQSVDCELEDSLSRTACKTIEIVECGSGPCDKAIINNGLLLCDCGDSVNCFRCANDRPFYNIVNPSDRIFLQFQQIDMVNGQNPAGPFGSFGLGDFVEIRAIDPCSEESSDELTEAITNNNFVGVFPIRDFKGVETWKNIQTFSFLVSDLITYLSGVFGPGWNQTFQLNICFNSGTPSEYCLCTEPYKLNPCPEKGDTVLLEGEYPDLDCFGYYYGNEAVGNGTFSFANFYRVKGSIEQTGFEISKNFVGTFKKSTSSDVSEKWQLRTFPVPAPVAKLITNILAAKNTFINGVEYISEGEVLRNNEEGSQWHIDHVLSRIDCSKTYSCN